MGRYLLDTHTLLWMQDDSAGLTEGIKKLLIDNNNDRYVSIVSFWEITIKMALGKLSLAYSIKELHDACVTSHVDLLPIQISSLELPADLPLHHKDPFDRLICAVALDLRLTVITCDENMRKYPINTLW